MLSLLVKIALIANRVFFLNFIQVKIALIANRVFFKTFSKITTTTTNNNNRLYFERVTQLVTKLIFHEALFYIHIYKDKRINSQTWTD